MFAASCLVKMVHMEHVTVNGNITGRLWLLTLFMTSFNFLHATAENYTKRSLQLRQLHGGAQP